LASYKIRKLVYREEPWKLLVHKLEYAEQKATVIIHKLEWGKYPNPVWSDELERLVTTWVSYDIEVINVPSDWEWNLAWCDTEGHCVVIPGTQRYGPGRVSGTWSYDGLHSISIPILGIVYPDQMPITEQTYESSWVTSTTLNYDVEMKDVDPYYEWYVTWADSPDHGTVIKGPITGPARVSGSFTYNRPLYAVWIGFRTIYKNEMPITERTYSYPAYTYYLDYDIDIEDISPYREIWINYMDDATHGFYIPGRTSPGTLKGTFGINRPLYQVAIQGDSAILQVIPAGELPIITVTEKTITLTGRVLTGDPPPDMTLTLWDLDYNTIIKEKTFPSVPPNETRQISFTDETPGTHTVKGIMKLKNPAGEKTYETDPYTYTV